MKKLFPYLIINFLLVVIIGFVISQVLISFFGTDERQNDFLQILIALLNLLSMQLGLLVSISFVTIFLNAIPFIQRNWFLSFLTFCGMPLGYLVYLLGGILIDSPADWDWSAFWKVLGPVVVFVSIHLVLALISFVIFRRKFSVKKQQ